MQHSADQTLGSVRFSVSTPVRSFGRKRNGSRWSYVYLIVYHAGHYYTRTHPVPGCSSIIAQSRESRLLRARASSLFFSFCARRFWFWFRFFLLSSCSCIRVFFFSSSFRFCREQSRGPPASGAWQMFRSPADGSDLLPLYYILATHTTWNTGISSSSPHRTRAYKVIYYIFVSVCSCVLYRHTTGRSFAASACRAV